MATIIKSNSVSLANFGTEKMQGTTPLAEYDKYKARVLADGGVVTNEAYVKQLFSWLFANNSYGRCNVLVSSYAGLKKRADGGVIKLYALDGVDLVLRSVGDSTEAPKLVNGYLDFIHNNGSVGSYFESSEAVSNLSESGSIFTAAHLARGEERPVGSNPVFAISSKATPYVAVQLTDINSATINGWVDIRYARSNDTSVRNYLPPAKEFGAKQDKAPIATLYENGRIRSYRGGVRITDDPFTGYTDTLINDSYYLQLGGIVTTEMSWVGASRVATVMSLRSFMLFDAASLATMPVPA